MFWKKSPKVPLSPALGHWTSDGLSQPIVGILFNMAPATTLEMHEAMVHWWFEQHKTAFKISKLADCSEQIVYNILQLHQDYGQITNPFACSRGHPHILDNGNVEYVHALLQANPTLYLDDLHETKMCPWQPYWTGISFCESLAMQIWSWDSWDQSLPIGFNMGNLQVSFPIPYPNPQTP